MLHTPSQDILRHALMALADDSPDLFEYYQDNHPQIPEATLKKRRLAASFIVGSASEGRFVGLYEVKGLSFKSAAELDASPQRQALMRRFRDASFSEIAARTGRPGREVFDLQPLGLLGELKGRLIVQRPPGRAYMRLAERCDLPVIEIQREAIFAPPPPAWDEFAVMGDEISNLPLSWKARLEQWRGIYLITDQTKGGRYVGSAYGETNILGRWQAHTAGKSGVTVELAKLNPNNFRFSILELVSPTAHMDLVMKLEASWKHRLHTREWGLNRN